MFFVCSNLFTFSVNENMTKYVIIDGASGSIHDDFASARNALTDDWLERFYKTIYGYGICTEDIMRFPELPQEYVTCEAFLRTWKALSDAQMHHALQLPNESDDFRAQSHEHPLGFYVVD